MKRQIGICVILMLLIGCLPLIKTEQFLCNPTPEQKLQAQAARAFIQSAIALIPDSPLKLQLFAADQVFVNILIPTVCVTAEQLKEAIKIVKDAAGTGEGEVTGVIVTKRGDIKLYSFPCAPNMSALEEWADKNGG